MDKYKRTPAMIAIRNNNNDCLVKLVENGCRIDKFDSSINSLLHYAAAYGNMEAITMLQDICPYRKNKKGLYPSEIALFKGHLTCAKKLHEAIPEGDFNEDPLYVLLGRIQGS